jgi:hypothetical protein
MRERWDVAVRRPPYRARHDDRFGRCRSAGPTIQVSAQGDVSDSVTSASNSIGSGNVNGDSAIAFKVTTPCRYTATGTITSSSQGGGTVVSPIVDLRGPSGTLLNVRSASCNTHGTLRPGNYGLGASAELDGNTDPSDLAFAAQADISGTVTITC